MGVPEGGILSRTDNSGNWRLWPLFVGLPLIALLAIAAIVLSGGGEGSERGDRPQGQSAGQDSRLGTPAIGSDDAPVVLTEYADYQ